MWFKTAIKQKQEEAALVCECVFYERSTLWLRGLGRRGQVLAGGRGGGGVTA